MKKLSILHCVSDYPVKKSEANLNSIKLLKDKLNLKIGYSDHTIGMNSASNSRRCWSGNHRETFHFR